MNLGQLYTGTERERQARGAVAEMDARVRKGKSLSPAHIKKLEEHRPIARGLSIRRGVINLSLMASTIFAGVAGCDQVVNGPYRQIDRAVAEKGLQVSSAEQALWGELRFTEYTPEAIQRDLARRGIDFLWTEAQVRMHQTASVMQRSENPYFRSAAEEINKPLVALDPRIDDLVLGRIIMMMGVDAEMAGNQIQYMIAPTVPMVLVSGPHDVASQLTHEAEHIKQFRRIIESLDPTLSMEDRLNFLNTKRRRFWIESFEPGAYGIQFLSEIEDRGRSGQRPKKVGSLNKFLNCGIDPVAPVLEGNLCLEQLAREINTPRS